VQWRWRIPPLASGAAICDALRHRMPHDAEDTIA
jgi:hypothetical protein